MSALTAAEYPELVDKLVLFYPALYIPDDASAGKMMFARFDPSHLPEIIRCGPMRLGRIYAADVLTMNPIEEISAYAGSVLIVHGTKDRIVRTEYSKQAKDVYCNVQLCLINGGGHGFSKKHDTIAMEYLTHFIS